LRAWYTWLPPPVKPSEPMDLAHTAADDARVRARMESMKAHESADDDMFSFQNIVTVVLVTVVIVGLVIMAVPEYRAAVLERFMSEPSAAKPEPKTKDEPEQPSEPKDADEGTDNQAAGEPIIVKDLEDINRAREARNLKVIFEEDPNVAVSRARSLSEEESHPVLLMLGSRTCGFAARQNRVILRSKVLQDMTIVVTDVFQKELGLELRQAAIPYLGIKRPGAEVEPLPTPTWVGFAKGTQLLRVPGMIPSKAIQEIANSLRKYTPAEEQKAADEPKPADSVLPDEAPAESAKALAGKAAMARMGEREDDRDTPVLEKPAVAAAAPASAPTQPVAPPTQPPTSKVVQLPDEPEEVAGSDALAEDAEDAEVETSPITTDDVLGAGTPSEDQAMTPPATDTDEVVGYTKSDDTDVDEEAEEAAGEDEEAAGEETAGRDEEAADEETAGRDEEAADDEDDELEFPPRRRPQNRRRRRRTD
jgi:hypothetical protein